MKKEMPVIQEKRVKNFFEKGVLIVLASALCIVPVFAQEAGVSEFNAVILFVCGWIARLGMVTALFGAVQVGFGFKNDDADGKVKGLKFLISGFIVFAIANESTISKLFGIS